MLWWTEIVSTGITGQYFTQLLYVSLTSLGTKLAIAKRADEEVVCIFCFSQRHYYIKSLHHSCQTPRSFPQGAEKMSCTFLDTAAHPLNTAHSSQVSASLLNKGTRRFKKRFPCAPSCRLVIGLWARLDQMSQKTNFIGPDSSFLFFFFYLRDNKI